jgi:hypothetical protein
MTERKRGGRRAKAGRGDGAIPQPPWRRVENPHAPSEIATA